MWVPKLPTALRWSHNVYYSSRLLRQLPTTIGSALDVGAGKGDLARALATRAAHVDAVDRSALMIDEASRTPSTVNWILGDILDYGLPLRPNGYDVVTAVSSLHHMPLEAGLKRLAELTAPGGHLIIIGLYRPTTPADYAAHAVALPANALKGALLATQGRAGKTEQGMPVHNPRETLRQIKQAAETTLPHSTTTRRLYFRYEINWYKQ